MRDRIGSRIDNRIGSRIDNRIGSRIDKILDAALGIKRAVLEMAYPSNIYCICCEKPIQPDQLYSICGDCMADIHWANGRTCVKCGKILQDWHKSERCLDCGRIGHRFLRGFTCVQYGERERALVHRLKYGQKGYMSKKIADIMADRMMLEDMELNLIVPVPMYKVKERQRGYNQAALLASALSRRIGVPTAKKILVRVRDTEPMNRLSPAERRHNMESAFMAAANAEEQIQGKTLLLVDDVFTTGSTADACSAALLAKGACAVYVLTFAAGANVEIK